MVTSSDGNGVDADSIVQAIHSSEAILIPVINLKNNGWYNDEGCALDSTSTGSLTITL